MPYPSGSRSGVTMIELLIGLAITAVITLGAFSLIIGFQRQTNQISSTTDAESELDDLAKMITDAMRTAYPPGLTKTQDISATFPPTPTPAPAPATILTYTPDTAVAACGGYCGVQLSASFTLPSTPAVTVTSAFAGGTATPGLSACQDMLIYRDQRVFSGGTPYIGANAIYFTTICNTSETLPGGVPALFSDIGCSTNTTSVVVRSYLTFTNAADPVNPTWNTSNPPGYGATTYTESIFPKNPLGIKNIAVCFRQAAAGNPVFVEIRAQTRGTDAWTSGKFIPVNRQITLNLPVRGSGQLLPPDK